MPEKDSNREVSSIPPIVVSLGSKLQNPSKICLTSFGETPLPRDTVLSSCKLEEEPPAVKEVFSGFLVCSPIVSSQVRVSKGL